jgi:hypothetical protein
MSDATTPVAQGGAPGERVQPQFHGSSTGGAPPPAAPPPAADPTEAPVERAPYDPSRAPKAADLPPDTLAARLAHAKEQAAKEARAEVYRTLGIEDPEKFKADRLKTDEELKRFRDSEEKRKRLEMTETQRLQADLDREKAARQKAEAKALELEETTISSQQEQVVQRAGLKVVHPRFYKFARGEFLTHVNELQATDPKQLDELTEQDVERFFRKLLKEYPEWAQQREADPHDAKAAEAKAAAEKAKAPVVRRPLSNGAPPPRMPALRPKSELQVPTDGANGKTILPGRENSMNRAELNQELKRRGLKSW